MPKPLLEGVRVLELASQLSGPYGAMVLADLGAEVTKMESPGRPDAARTVPSATVGGQATYYLSLNRNKRSVLLGLKDQRGHDAFLKLVAISDVVLDNFRPGVMERLEIDHAHLAEVNPGIITCSLSGFGQTGPERHRPGYDYLVQALAGTMSLTAIRTGRPPSTASPSSTTSEGSSRSSGSCRPWPRGTAIRKAADRRWTSRCWTRTCRC